MATRQLNKMIRALRNAALPHDAGLSDGQLLDLFIDQHDEAAFAALVHRHGVMVWGVCRRIVAHHHDAEDAFQATFLVLARKAHSVRPRAMVANWLYGVAQRVALKAKASASKRHGKEKQMMPMPEPAAKAPAAAPELEAFLDQELAALPDKYRIAILLCDLEGKTGKDVARQLKIPEGTLATRLRTARAMLAKRLARHRISLAAGSLAAVLSRDSASASVIASAIQLATATPAIPAKVAALTTAALQAMLMDKLKTLMLVLLLLSAAAFGGGLVAQQMMEDGGGDANAQQELVQADDKLHGEWIGKDKSGEIRFIFGPGGAFQHIKKDFHGKGKYSLDRKKEPHHLNLNWQSVRSGDAEFSFGEKIHPTIIEFQANGQLRMEMNTGGTRPKAFTQEGSVLLTKKTKDDGIEKKKSAADRFGDSLPNGAIGRLGTVRLRHAHGVRGVAYSPDGKALASVGDDDAVRLWDRRTGRQIRQFSTPRLGNCGIVFSPDGTKLVSDDNVGNIRLWDVESGKMLYEKRGHEGRVHAVAFAPDGRTFASAGGNVCVWATTTGAAIRTFQATGRFIADSQGVAFSDDGKLLAASFRDKVHVWDLKRDAPPVEIAKAHGPLTTSLIFAGNTTLLSGGHSVVRSWNAANGQQIRELKTASGYGGTLALSADREVLAAAYWNKIKIWNQRTGESIRDLDDFRDFFGPKAHHLAVSPNGKEVAAAMDDNAVRVWDVATGKRLLDFPDSHSGRINSIAHSPDGRHVLTAGNEGTVRLWNAANGQHVRSFSLPKSEVVGEMRAAFSHNGKMAAAVGYTDSPERRFAGACWVWDVATGKQLHLSTFPHRANAVSFSPDDKMLAISVSEDRPEGTTFYLWDFQSGMEPVIFAKHSGRHTEGFRFLPNGKTVSALQDGSLLSWDIASKKEAATLGHSSEYMWAAVFSTDGKIAVTASMAADHFVVWDVATATTLYPIQCGARPFAVLALSPDGRLLASAHPFNSTNTKFDPSIRVWEMRTGQEILRFQPGNTSVMAFAFSPQGRTLTSAMADGTALSWNLDPNAAKTLAPKNLEQLWADLASQDASLAYQAICTLAARAGQSVPFLADHLAPAKAADPKHLAALLGDLDNNTFAIREQAAKELERLHEQARPAFQQALAQPRPLESRRRMESLLAKLRQPLTASELLTSVRAVEVLERIGNRAAQTLLTKLAEGAPEARLTHEARQALARLEKR